MKKLCWVLCFVVMLFLQHSVFVSSVSASSVLLDFAPNNTKMNSSLFLRYEDIHGFGTMDVSSAAAPLIIADPLAAPHFDSISNPPDLLPGGGSTVLKDAITGQLDFKLGFGIPVAGATHLDDTFNVHISGRMSAVDAHNAIGYASDAISEGKAVAEFYLDAAHGGAVGGAVVGFALFPKLTMGPFDRVVEVIITEMDPVTGISVVSPYAAPHPDFAHSLLGDRYYKIAFSYAALVPFSVDPPYGIDYSYSLNYSSALVPEPASIGLIGFGLLGLGLIRRQRKRGVVRH